MKKLTTRPTCANLLRATPQELEWLRDHRCQAHGHRYISHFGCFLKEQEIKEKIGALDIEASNLKANFGVMLSWCIKTVGEDELLSDCMTSRDIKKGLKDKRIVTSCVDAMMKYDRVIGHFSTYFDIPFIRTRALILGVPFPAFGQLYHTDVWKMSKKSMCLHSRRQDVVAKAIQGIDIKTRIHEDIWLDVQFGTDRQRKAGLKYVLDHNEKDVVQLEGNFLGLLPYVPTRRTSI
jgi:DNA polymerase elongation subunit (family B)